jgi:hypothetical protein
MFVQEYYNLDTFPFGDAIKDWVENKVKYAMDFKHFCSFSQ